MGKLQEYLDNEIPLANSPIGTERIYGTQSGASAAFTPNLIRSSSVKTKTDSYLLELSDAFATILMNKATPTNLTIPPDGDVSWVNETVFYSMRIGAGTMTFVAGVGVTLITSAGVLTDAGQNVLMSAIKIGANTWYVQNGVAIDAVPTSRTINSLSLAANRILPQFRGRQKYAGFYYPFADLNCNTFTAAANPNNILRAYPFVLDLPWTFNELKSEVSTLSAATLYRLGIYTDNGSGYPDALVAGTDIAEYDSSTTGVKTGTAGGNITLTPDGSPNGVHYLVIGANSAGASLRHFGITNWPNVLGYLSTIGATSGIVGYTVARTYGAMPATFPGSATTVANGSTVPIVLANVV